MPGTPGLSCRQTGRPRSIVVKRLFDQLVRVSFSEEIDEVNVLREDRGRRIQDVAEHGDPMGVKGAMIAWLNQFIVGIDLAKASSCFCP